MDLSHHTAENKLRQEWQKITDSGLVRWSPETQSQFLEQAADDPAILTTGSNGVNFIPRPDFNKRLQLFTGGALNYLNWDGIVLAGGCISNIINANVTPDNLTDTDIDLFFYGLSEEATRAKITQTVTEITSAIMDRYPSGQVTILKNDHVITLAHSDKKIKVQLIYSRLYTCIYQILAGFDVDSCAVAYNGQQAFLTPRSLNAFQTRFNVVDLSRRSPSYEQRLHKYSQRGFGIYIPFEWSDYNKLYFLNRHTRGLDRLLILQRYNRRPGLQKLLNYITKRRNIKFNKKVGSDYEANEEIDLSTKQAIKISISQYNLRVPDEFKYTIHSTDSLAVDIAGVTFTTLDPGHQLTGSFKPITTGDWVEVDYAQFGVDFIGRSMVLQNIKAGGPVVLEELYTHKTRDNSLFNTLDYLIMYHPNEEFLTNAWDNRHRFLFSSHAKNLYGIGYLELAMICRRYTLVQHIFAKEQAGLVWNKYINLALFLDDLTLLKSIFRYYKNSIYEQRENIKKYRSTRISKHFGMQLEAEDRSLVTLLDGMTPKQRIDHYLQNPGLYDWNTCSNLVRAGDYQRFSDSELFLFYHKLETGHCNPLKELLLADLKRDIVVDDTFANEYPRGSFESQWLSICYDACLAVETNKNKDRNERARKFLLQVMPRKQFLAARKVQFINPIVTMNAHVLVVMRRLWERDFDHLKINIWADTPDLDDYRKLIFALDDYSIVAHFVKPDHLGGFLGKWKNHLGPNLTQKFEELKARQVSLSTELHRKYAGALCNTAEHLQVLETGRLGTNNIFAENAFGQTPFDYSIGQLLHFYCGGEGGAAELRDVDMDLLVNLRETTENIDRTQPVNACTWEMVCNSDLDLLVERI